MKVPVNRECLPVAGKPLRRRVRLTTLAAVEEARESYKRVDGSMVSQTEVLRKAITWAKGSGSVQGFCFSDSCTVGESRVVEVADCSLPDGWSLDTVVTLYLERLARMARAVRPPIKIDPADRAEMRKRPRVERPYMGKPEVCCG